MRWWLLLGVIACDRGGAGPAVTEPEETVPEETEPKIRDTGMEVKTSGPAPCDPVKGLTVTDVAVTAPWNENEAAFTVTLSQAASVAVSCQLVTDPATMALDPDEIHLVEGQTESEVHGLQLAGLLASSQYQCKVAPVCPSMTTGPFVFDLETGARSNADLPTILLNLKEDRAGNDYIVTNNQRDANWNGQRRLVIDRDGNIRWHMLESAGGTVGGSAINFDPETMAFTIGGGWPPNGSGRPQEIDLFGSVTLYDTKPHLPNYDATVFHHEARKLSDGRFLTMEEPVVNRPNGGTLRGFGLRIVNPDTTNVDFDYSSQRGLDEGHLPDGSGDAYHANWADVVDVDGTEVAHVSLCSQGWTVAIDVPTGNWRWTFGKGGDFSLVDKDGQPLPESEFPQCQHGLQKRGDRLLVYDNGNHGRNHSRAAEYQLDESTMTAKLLWSWTEPNWFERSLGGVAWSSGDRVMISMGHIESATPTPGDLTTFVEIDPLNGDKLWEIQYSKTNDMAFRLESIAPCDIFANAKYCAVTAARLETLAPLFEEP